ncbi:MAG: EamA-like transporter family protein [Promethearchaeota archaeon]|nr:MAG: EamA-like transporter family protein [Candidatus Lokiarchaeota archaeon]
MKIEVKTNFFIFFYILSPNLSNENIKKGITYGVLGVFLIGLQPIVANARPSYLDAYIFAAMTTIIESLLFFPLMLLERRKLKSEKQNGTMDVEIVERKLHGWKANKILLFLVGLNFGIMQILFFLGYEWAGSINGALAQKTTVLFSLLFGYLLLGERITKVQVLFSILLFIGLIFAVTEGSFDLLSFNPGVIVLLITTCFWMLAHTLTKPVFRRNEATPTQMVFVRNLISGLILFSTYFIFFPLENLSFFLDPVNNFFFITMGVVYGSGLFCWYNSLENLDVSKASILASPTPIATAFFSFIIFQEILSIFQLIGSFIVIISIIIIFKSKPNPKEGDLESSEEENTTE